MTRSVVLAVDGGNSKTDVALLGLDGSLLGAVRGPGSSPHALGLDGSMRVIASLVDAACQQANLCPDRTPVAAVGAWFMAGADLPAEERALCRAVDDLGVSARNQVANDTFAILRAGSDTGWGIAVVCGAGINCVGRAPDGRTVRFPALGDITGDWGGGPDIGLAALAAAVRAEDRRGSATVLRAVVAGHFGQRRATDVAICIHDGRIRRDRLLDLPPLVIDAAVAGDEVAVGILQRQADEIVSLAGAALRRLRLTRREVAVVLGGSVLAALPASIVDRIREELTLVAPLATCVLCRDRPIVGAALAALDLGGARAASGRRARRELGNGAVSEVAG